MRHREEKIREGLEKEVMVIRQIGMEYGAEIWSWRERNKVERLHERFLRWVLGLDSRTPVIW